jgi:hypothetical protein
MKTYEEVDVWIHIFYTSALLGGERSTTRPGRFTPGERSAGTDWIVGWVGPRARVDDVEKSKILTVSILELRPLGRPDRGQTLYRLRYPSSHYIYIY